MHKSVSRVSAADEGRGHGRPQSAREEVANSVSHGTGFVAALIGTPFLLAEVARVGGPADLVGAAVFMVTVMVAYLASTLYHAVPWPLTSAWAGWS